MLRMTGSDVQQSFRDSRQHSIADENVIRMNIANSVSEIGEILPRAELAASANGVPWGARAESRTIRWWLWWNVLSVDAPTVAVVWAALFAHASGGKLSAAEAIVLVLAVWLIYVSDRLLDGWTAKDRAALHERHHFCERHRLVLSGLVAFASGALVWLTTEHLPAAEVTAGVKLGVILVLYMTGIHAGRGRVARVFPKEIAVGLLFACGGTLPLWSRSIQFPWGACLPWILFGFLCALNCLSIECWENRPRSGEWRQPPHPFVRWADSRLNRMAAALAIAALAACLVRDPKDSSISALLAVWLGALLLVFLNYGRTKLSPAALRVLADAALLVPALLALVIGG
jgi:hypothetical protein